MLADSSDPILSVVVPTYNRRAALARLLAALASQTLSPLRFEVVVVDDGSADGTVAWLRLQAFPFELRILECDHRGPSSARNAGIEAARATRILFLDDDVVPVPTNLIEHLADAAAHDPAHVVMIGPMSPPAGARRPPWLRWVDRTLDRQYRALAAGEYAPTARQFYTANASVPRALLLKVGGFDYRFLRGEDVELAYRLAEAGANFAFNPGADVHHYAEHSFAAWRRTYYQYGRYDVVVEREKGQPAFWVATHDFHRRLPSIRQLVRVAVGRPRLVHAAVHALSDLALAAARIGVEPAAMLALSALASLLYWQGAADELGGAAAVRERLEAAAREIAAQEIAIAGRGSRALSG